MSEEEQQPKHLRSQGRMHVIVRGKVQGVYFRKHTEAEATRLGLTGWVRNLPTGEVEVVAEGAMDALQQLEEWLKHTGSPASRIDETVVTHAKPSDEFSSFVQLRGAAARF